MAVIKKAKKIGELLVDAGLITPSQLEEALNVSQKTGARLLLKRYNYRPADCQAHT